MTWSTVSGKLKTVFVFAALAVTLAAGATVIPFLLGAGTANRGPAKTTPRYQELYRQEREAFDRNWREMEQRQKQRMREYREASARRATEREAQRTKPYTIPKPARRVRRYAWESPAETRARLWNVPEEETEQATITGLLRICTSEQVGSERDCIGIWQVLRNIRNRGCTRETHRRITECDDKGETMVSTMRRINRYALGLVPAKTARQQWISELQTDCKRPPSFRAGEKAWQRHHLKACQDTARLATQLVKGQRRQRLTPAHIIAWGGRCEDEGGACDDPIACARGLARVTGLGTANAFWCRPGAPSCPKDIDPVCIEMGYRSFGTLEPSKETAMISTNSKKSEPGS